MNGLVMTFEEDEIFVFGCSIMWAILPIREWRCQDIDQVLLHEIIFFCRSIFSSSEVLGKIASRFGVNVSGRKERKLWSQPALACFMSKATSVPQTPQTNHWQYSSPVEALNLIVDSKSQPVELDNSTIELHVPSRRKKSLQSYCSVDFDFLGLMRFDMTFDITLRDDSSFGKLTNSCD